MPFLPETFDWFESMTLAADWWGIIGLVATVLIAVLSYFTFRHFNRLGALLTRTVLLAYFVFRVVLMAQYAAETGNVLDVVPLELPSLCFLLLPIAVLLDLPREVKSQLALASFFVGLVTMIGMAVSPLTFEELGTTAVLDALVSYAIMTVVPIVLLVTDQLRYTLKRGLPVTFTLLAVLIGLGYLLNRVVYPGHNVFYLETSVLPFSISGIPVVDYLVFLVPILVLFYVSMHFFHKSHDRYRAKRAARLARENVLLKESRRAKRLARKEARKLKREERRGERAAGKDLDI